MFIKNSSKLNFLLLKLETRNFIINNKILLLKLENKIIKLKKKFNQYKLENS